MIGLFIAAMVLWVCRFGDTVEPEFYDHPFCQAKVVVNARWSLKTGSDVT